MTTKLIFTSPNRLIFVRLRNFCIALLVLMVVLNRRNQLILSLKKIIGEDGSWIVLAILIIIIISGLVFHSYSRKKRNVGKITLSQDSITIHKRNMVQEFSLDEVSHFQIRQSFDDVKTDQVALMSSYDNWLSFEYRNNRYEFQFLIDSNYHKNQLSDLMNSWKVRMDIKP